MAITQLSVFAENKPGSLVSITQILAEEGVDIRALSLADTSDYGILRLIVSDTEKAQNALSNAGLALHLSPVIGVAMSDRPGALAEVLTTLEENNINIEYMYAFISRLAEDAYVILRTEHTQEAEMILKENGAKLLTEQDIETHLG